jgi:hypothetical protein
MVGSRFSFTTVLKWKRLYCDMIILGVVGRRADEFPEHGWMRDMVDGYEINENPSDSIPAAHISVWPSRNSA